MNNADARPLKAQRTRRVSLTLEEELLAEAREVAGSRGLSSYVNRALRSQLQHDRLAGLVPALDRVPGSAKGKLVVPDDLDAPIEDFREYS